MGNEEGVDEVAFGYGGMDGAIGLEVGEEIFAEFGGEGPEGRIADDVEAEIPGFGGFAGNVLAMKDLETSVDEIGGVVVHGVHFNEHALLDGTNVFAGELGSEAGGFEPVGDGKNAAGFEKARGIGEKFATVVIMGDGLDRPEEVELAVEIESFGVHEEELRVEIFSGGSVAGHFDLNGRDIYAGGTGLELAGQEETAGPEAAADVEHFGTLRDVGQASEVFGELELGLFFGFVAANPVAMMEVFAPEGVVVRTDLVVMLDDFAFVVGTGDRGTVQGRGWGHGALWRDDCTAKRGGGPC